MSFGAENQSQKKIPILTRGANKVAASSVQELALAILYPYI